jgi:hypothetical protein
MKTKTIYSTLLITFAMLLSINGNAQKFSNLDASPLDLATYRTERGAPAIVKVLYSRPQLKGRDLNSLAPKGKIWRTGANEATEITFSKAVNFGDKQVKAGTYSLFTIPGDNEWTIILNSNTGGWGAYGYEESNDVARVKGKVSSGDEVEAFSIAFDKSGTMYLAWGKTRVSVPIK